MTNITDEIFEDAKAAGFLINDDDFGNLTICQPYANADYQSILSKFAELTLKRGSGEPVLASIFDENEEHVYSVCVKAFNSKEIAWDLAQDHINDAVIEKLKSIKEFNDSPSKWKVKFTYTAPPTTEVKQYVELAWLVEKTIKGCLHYLYVPCTGLLDWTPSNSKAIRFARREDADMMCNLVEDADRVAEHVWCEALSTKPLELKG